MSSDHALRIARARISKESDALTGYLDLGQLGLTELPTELFSLKHLRRLNLGSGMFGEHERGEWVYAVSEIAPNQLDARLADLSGLPNLMALSVRAAKLTSLDGIQNLSTLQSLVCSRTQISDLSPLAELRQLQVLVCSRTNVSDLAPLQQLQQLQELNCARTPIASLAPLVGWRNLRILSCARTFVSDLTPASQLEHLEELQCQGNNITDLAPLAGLRELRVLNCAGTQINEITPLGAVKELRILFCSRTRVSDLTPLQGTDRLIEFRCSSTRVEDVAPLSILRRLEVLVCSNTRIKDLTPLAALRRLRHVNLSHCNLSTVPEGFWKKGSLQELILFETQLAETPPEVLSQDPGGNCLYSLRAHLRDLKAGVSNITDIKMVVLGNGGIGKTQLVRRLCDQDYDPRVSSTHGITITPTGLATEEDKEGTILRIWDFGGQDIYHGTHILFMRTGAIFVVVWIPQSESSREQVWKGMRFRNQPLSYWIGSVRRLGKRGSPLIIVQARCDRLEDEVHRLPVVPELLGALPHWELRYSALNDRGRAALDEALREAVTRVRQNCGFMSIGSGRFRVKQRLDALRDADAAVPPEQRQYRTLSQEYFQQLCDEAGGISSPRHFLYYLHNTGIVFYREGMFADRIILDQAWALDSIYSVFNRENCYRQLLYLRGRFTRPLLEALIWQDHDVNEQEVFLSMMRSCGICFIHRRWVHDDEEFEEYIAPDLLPNREQIQSDLDAIWDCHLPSEAIEFDYEFTYPGVIRALMARVGSEAGISGLYWRSGFCVYEISTGSRAIIEQEMTDVWRGKILVQTQRGRASELLQELARLVQSESSRAGARKMTEAGQYRRSLPLSLSVDYDDDPDRPRASRRTLNFGQDRSEGHQYFVSYAWGDDTPEGRVRDDVVERLCAEAEKRGIKILRDKSVLRPGDSISRFMSQLASGDRVFVVLSDKYLRSPYCMYELMEIWRTCAAEEQVFLDRIRLYVVPGTRIFSLSERAQYAVYWRKEYEKVSDLIHNDGPDVVGRRGFQEYRLMDDFRRWVAEILETIADRLQPRNFEELAKFGLDDLAAK